jgi:hypothetical protein
MEITTLSPGLKVFIKFLFVMYEARIHVFIESLNLFKLY